ncbi:uncharacterized protein LOC141915175 [Tubulanus polymorphus]|uniref:uncharacterized protein LOC141915175 n=1 Tax=Tubulanus polymorphus TaxID=672921 RepID=UPI003DA53363
MSVYDRSRAMEERQKRNALQVRMKNVQEKRCLDEKVQKMNSDLEKQVFLINKSMFNIRYDMKDMSEIPSSIFDDIPRDKGAVLNNSSKKTKKNRRKSDFPKDDDVLTQVQIVAEDEVECKMKNGFSQESTKILDGVSEVVEEGVCKYKAFDPNHTCSYFPCKKPETYSHISDILANSRTPDDDILLGQPAYMSNNKLNDTRIKEKALRSMIKEMRLKNQANKPVDRCTNYGTPISFRKMTTVARPSVSE